MRHFNHIANDAILVSRPMPMQRSRWMLASAFESLRSYLDGSFSKGGRHSIADSSSGAANCPPVALPAYLPRRRSHQIASLRSTRFLYYRSVVNRQLFCRLASVPVATAGDGQASAAQSCLPPLRSFHISIHPSATPTGNSCHPSFSSPASTYVLSSIYPVSVLLPSSLFLASSSVYSSRTREDDFRSLRGCDCLMSERCN